MARKGHLQNKAFAPAIQGAAQTKSALNSHGMTIPHHVRQPGGSTKVETVNSSPAPFGKNSANFLRTPKTAKSFETAEKVLSLHQPESALSQFAGCGELV